MMWVYYQGDCKAKFNSVSISVYCNSIATPGLRRWFKIRKQRRLCEACCKQTPSRYDVCHVLFASIFIGQREFACPKVLTPKVTSGQPVYLNH